MKNEIIRYVNVFEDLYKGRPWLGVTYRSVLSKVNNDTAFNKPGRRIHSIAEILCHVIDYRKFLIAQFEHNDKFDVNQRASFNTAKYAGNKKDKWPDILRTLKKTQTSLVNALRNSNDEILMRKVFHRKYNIKYLLDGIIQHDIYHLGQLILLSKMFNNNK